ncbi:MAG: hypothetical protein PHX83_03525 [Acidobacteriia bacterium]|nr:hypothetical protein [Terriglobia bacterium]
MFLEFLRGFFETLPRPSFAGHQNRRAGHLRRAALLAAFLVLTRPVRGDDPYFVTYSHHMEEPGNLEVGFNPSFAKPKGGNSFLGTLTEYEYGTRAWWTTEFYLEGAAVRNEGSAFTGYRIENRIRPLAGSHWINPVFYFEFEDINAANKSLKEVVGFDSQSDLAEPVSEARQEKERELELKLILGSDFKGWNLSENFVAERNLTHEPWEFGYAVGASRPLALEASPEECTFCRENFRVGLEMYGGLGDAHHFTARGTSHYLAPMVSWELPGGVTLRLSPGFGLTPHSVRTVLRVGVSYEIQDFGRKVRKLLH